MFAISFRYFALLFVLRCFFLPALIAVRLLVLALTDFC